MLYTHDVPTDALADALADALTGTLPDARSDRPRPNVLHSLTDSPSAPHAADQHQASLSTAATGTHWHRAVHKFGCLLSAVSVLLSAVERTSDLLQTRSKSKVNEIERN